MFKYVYIVLMNSSHEILLDVCDPMFLTKRCLPKIEVPSIEDSLMKIHEVFRNRYQVNFPQFLGSNGLDSEFPIYMFKMNEGFSYRTQLASFSLFNCVHNYIDEELKQPVWDAYCKLVLNGYSLPFKKIYSIAFGHDVDQSHYLGSLILSGRKKAASSLLWSYEYDDDSTPKIGDITVVRDELGHAMCVISTTHVEIVPFNKVTQEFAYLEGEGDQSLRFWRLVHWDFFAEECISMGMEPQGDMPVICEKFEMVHKVINYG